MNGREEEVLHLDVPVGLRLRNETLGGYVPLTAQIIYFTYVALIFLLGIPGNLIIVIVYAKTKPKKSCDWFILFIGVTDFVVCLVSPGLCVHLEVGFEFPYINNLMCGFEQLWQLAAMTASCFIFTLMSIERYIRVCRPTMKSFTPIMSRNTSIMCMILAVIASTYPTYRQFSKNTCYHWDIVDTVPVENMYIYFACFVCCFVAVAFAYGSVIFTIEKKIRMKQRLMENTGLHDDKLTHKDEIEKHTVPADDHLKIPPCVDDSSDKNDSGFNQVELDVAHGRLEEDGKALAKSTDRVAREKIQANSPHELRSPPLRDDLIPSTDLHEEENDNASTVNEHLLSNYKSSEPQTAADVKLNNEEMVIPDENVQINLTENPIYCETFVHPKDESRDGGHIDDVHSLHKVNGNSERRQLRGHNQNTVSIWNNVRTDCGASFPSHHNLQNYLKPNDIKADKHSFALSSDFDYLDDDLYSELVQPKALFKRAKKNLNEIRDKISHIKKRSENSRRKRWLRERQVTLMLLYVTAIFLGTWIPPWILYLMASHQCYVFPAGIATRIVYRYCDKVYLFNYICNFSIYYRFNSTFRMKAKAIIPKCVIKYCLCWCLRNLDEETDV